MSRRQRRAQQKPTPKSTIESANDIPYTRPSDTQPKPARTLFEIAAEKQTQLSPNTPKFDPSKASNVVNVKIGKDGNIVPSPTPTSDSPSDEPEVESEAEISPWLDTLLLATSLSALNLTLEALTVHQYAQELLFLPIIKTTIFIAFPTLTLLIHLFHGHLFPNPIPSSLWTPNTQAAVLALRQGVLLLVANLAGCYLIQLTNDKGYYAVMKNAPSIGTLWVWAILELGLLGAVLGVLGPGVYAWRSGYGIF